MGRRGCARGMGYDFRRRGGERMAACPLPACRCASEAGRPPACRGEAGGSRPERCRRPPSGRGSGGSARAEGPGPRRRGRGRHHRRCPAGRSAPHLRQRGVRARDGVLGGRDARPELPVPAGPRHRPGSGRRDPRRGRRRARVHRRDPELPPGRHPLLEPALDHAGAQRARRGHPLHRDPVGRHRASRGRERAAARQGGARTRPPAGRAGPAGPAPAGGAEPAGLAHRAHVPSLCGPGR